MIDLEFLNILCCQETKQSLHCADKTLVNQVNCRIGEKQLRNRFGDIIDKRIDEGLIREDGLVLYPIRSDIPVLIIEASVDLKSL